MKLIRTLLDRLSDGLFVSVPEMRGLATELSNVPPLRLVSDKSVLSAPIDSVTRRQANTISQVDALDDAIRRSQTWFLSRQHASEGYWVAELEADTTLTPNISCCGGFLIGSIPSESAERSAISVPCNCPMADGRFSMEGLPRSAPQ